MDLHEYRRTMALVGALALDLRKADLLTLEIAARRLGTWDELVLLGVLRRAVADMPPLPERVGKTPLIGEEPTEYGGPQP